MDEFMKDMRPTTLVARAGENTNREDHCKASSLLVWNLKQTGNCLIPSLRWQAEPSCPQRLVWYTVSVWVFWRNKHLNGIKYARILLEKVPAAENEEGGWGETPDGLSLNEEQRKEGWMEAF